MTGKIAVVTGAGSGIGRRAAIALGEQGWNVVLAARRIQTLEETAADSAFSGGNCMVHPADVSKPDEVRRLFEAVAARYGRLDLLFNNAGVFYTKPVEEIEPADWEKSMAVNLNGAFYCAQAAFRQMKGQRPQGGRIINNGSVSAHVPRPHAAPYTVAKHAITGLTKSLSLEGRGFDIACGQIDIGNAASPMTEAMPKGVLQADGTLKSEPTMDIANVVQAILFMASLPLDANVQFMTVMATAMPYIGRG
ncbi:MAG: SDR family oxidoreductase [Rhizobium sp.]|nr:MAG: SDR family oxidoreductase [Rhizobium sp.]